MELNFPKRCVILAAGPSGVGKTTFFRKHCAPTMVESADMFRGLLCDDENNQDHQVAKRAFALLHDLVRARIALGLPVVIDTLALKTRARQSLIQLSENCGVEPHIVILTGDVGLCRAGQEQRGVRRMPPGVDEQMQLNLHDTLKAVHEERFASVTVLDRAQANQVTGIRFGGETRTGDVPAPDAHSRPAGPAVLSLELISRLLDDGHRPRDEREVRKAAFALLLGIVRGRLELRRPTQVNVTSLKPHELRGVAELADAHDLCTADIPFKGEMLSFEFAAPVAPVAGNQFDIIGDVHGCYDELVELLGQLGYAFDEQRGVYAHPTRTAVFVGDITDRGPRSLDAFGLVRDMLRAGTALAVRGNHDDKLMRWAKGSNVKVSHGLEKTVAEFEELFRSDQDAAVALREEIQELFAGVPYQLVLDEGRLVVVHGGLKPWMVGREDFGRKKGPIASICLYGEADGFLENGLPNRLDFTRDWDLDQVTLVYGHQVFEEVRTSGPNLNCYGIDTGCTFGGFLTALRYPQMELVQVPAKLNYDAAQEQLA